MRVASEPTSTLTTTTTAAQPDPDASPIYASSFPHIIEAIIGYASPAVLLAFRNTCTVYRTRITEERVAERFLRDAETRCGRAATGLHLHLHVEVEVSRSPASDNSNTRSVAGPPSHEHPSHHHHLVASFPTADGPCAAPAFLAPRVGIVTLHAADLDGNFDVTRPAARILDQANVSLEVVRITDFDGATTKIPFQAPKYVLFMNADHVDDDDCDCDDEDSLDMDIDMDSDMGMDAGNQHTESNYFTLPHNSGPRPAGLASNSGATPASWPSFSGAQFVQGSTSPFPDNVTEVVCNIACSPNVSCTNLTHSQLSALNLGRRGILSNIIYIFRPIPEEPPAVHRRNSHSHSHSHGHHEDAKRDTKGKAKADPKDIPGGNRRSSRSSRTSSPSPVSSPASLPGSPPESPALVPFLDNQLSWFPSPDFTIVGCENLRYWADPEVTLFARFASIMNPYCDFELNIGNYHHVAPAAADPDVHVEVALGFDVPAYDDGLDRSRYFKSFPQWTASHARSDRARAWYDLMTVP